MQEYMSGLPRVCKDYLRERGLIEHIQGADTHPRVPQHVRDVLQEIVSEYARERFGEEEVESQSSREAFARLALRNVMQERPVLLIELAAGTSTFADGHYSREIFDFSFYWSVARNYMLERGLIEWYTGSTAPYRVPKEVVKLLPEVLGEQQASSVEFAATEPEPQAPDADPVGSDSGSDEDEFHPPCTVL